MSAFKVTDLLLGEKNFIDFVDKNLGQEWDRFKSNELETDKVCHHLAGGILDYPVMISHDFADITTAVDIYMDSFTKDTSSKIPKPYCYGVFRKKVEKNERMGKMPFRGDELTVKQFINAILGACPKMRTHIINCNDEATKSGRLENIYVIISNAIMVRNYLWVFLELLETDSKSKLKSEYKEYCDLAEVLSEQMLQIFGNLLTTFILHDEQSQNFSAHRPYYEGERGSPVISVWAYFIRSMQRDMWQIMPPQLSQRVLAIIVNDSLAILTARYSQIKPTEATTQQYSVDIINILASVEEFLFFISSDLSTVCGHMDPSKSKVLFSIHMKCHCLTAALLTVGAPLEVLYKTFRRGLSSCSLMDMRLKSLTKITEPPWMSSLSFLCPKFYPADLNYSDWELLFNLKLLISQPASVWPLVYRVVTMNNCKIAKFIISLFPTVSAPVIHFLLEGQGFRRCKFASCMDPDCHGLPKSLPNHLVSSCILYTIAHGLPWEAFAEVYRPILPRISDWNAMDKTQIWNSKTRPVWFESLIDVLLPILKTCVQSLVLSILENVPPVSECEKNVSIVLEKGSTSAPGKSTVISQRSSVGQLLNVDAEKEEDLVTQWVIELLNTVTEMVSIIPRGFFLVCEEMDDLIPRTFIPVRNNVPIHFLVSALYMLLNLGSGIINSIVPEDPAPIAQDGPKTKAVPAKTSKKTARPGKKEPSPAPSASNRLEPCLLSAAERLCHLDDPIFDQIVHRLITQIESMMKQTKSQQSTKIPIAEEIMDDFAMELDISHIKSDFLMENVEGQLALRVIYWFILTHSDMIETALTGEINKDSPSKKRRKHPSDFSSKEAMNANESTHNLPHAIEKSHSGPTASTSKLKHKDTKVNPAVLKMIPRIRTTLKSVNNIHEFHFVNRYRTFDEIIWDPRNLEWVQTVRKCRMGLQRPIIGKLLERRWEFRQNLLEETCTDGKVDDKSRNLMKMVDEIKALFLT